MSRGRKAGEDIAVASSVEPIDGATEPVRSEARITGIEATDFAAESPEELGTFAATVDDSGELLGTTTVNTSGTGKRRGRPPGSKTGTRKAAPQKIQTPVSHEKVADMVFKIHTMLAATTHIPELMLTPDESGDLTKAVMEVAGFYSMQFDPKNVAWANLCFVLACTYGTRIVAFNQRSKSESRKPETKPAEKVVTIA